MNRQERRAAERKRSAFIAQMQAGKQAKLVRDIEVHLVVKRAVHLPDERALAMVARYRTEQIKRYVHVARAA